MGIHLGFQHLNFHFTLVFFHLCIFFHKLHDFLGHLVELGDQQAYFIPALCPLGEGYSQHAVFHTFHGFHGIRKRTGNITHPEYGEKDGKYGNGYYGYAENNLDVLDILQYNGQRRLIHHCPAVEVERIAENLLIAFLKSEGAVILISYILVFSPFPDL